VRVGARRVCPKREHRKKDLSQAEIDRIVKAFTTNETQFRSALNSYNFNRSANISTVGMGGQISGTYRRDSALTLTEDGRRLEKILFAPVSTLTEITVTAADLDNLSGVDQFAIEPSIIGNYNFTYVGKEKIDELDLYVFDVALKVMPDPKKVKQRFFGGRIWVDDRDLMIVKTKGKAFPAPKGEQFPVVETWRENVDGKYWFPSLAMVDDELVFDSGQVVKVKMRVNTPTTPSAEAKCEFWTTRKKSKKNRNPARRRLRRQRNRNL
jgi:hypothetical protein